MKIVFSMAYMRGGGAERVVSELANYFADSGHDVSIILTKRSGCVYSMREQIKLIDLSESNKGFFSRVRAVRRCLKDHHFDVVISFLINSNLETILASSMLKVPVIISERNNPYTDPKDRVYRFLRKVIYPFADGYVFQTPDARAFFSKRIQKKSTVIMNPINPELPEAYTGQREKRVVNVGRLFPQKNQKMFIDAFCAFYRTHPEYIAEIYGDGPMEQELTEYIRDKGMEEKILLRGFFADLMPEITSAGMFVMSSDYEGMSNALIEAVGMGIPCISTDHPIGGARMTVENGVSGFLVPVRDAHTMAEKMSELADNEALAKSLSRQGILLREKLSLNVIAGQWLDYIDAVKSRCSK